MKYIVLIGDGMADRPIESLGGRTPLQYANIPHMDKIASLGEEGLVRTIPIGCPPGSDTGNLSIMGYNPKLVYTGRSPLEAVSLGVDMCPADIALRCNLVTLSDAPTFAARTMVSHSAGGITQEEAVPLVDALNAHFATDKLSFVFGASYRHVTVMRDRGDIDLAQLTTYPPHEHVDAPVGDILPTGPLSEELRDLIRRSVPLLEGHPINRARREKGLPMANAIWFWGEGRKPDLVPLTARTGLSGSVVSAVPLIHGIGQCAGLKSIFVQGATADLHTNYEGKARAAIKALKEGDDLVFVHIEAPDECGHDGDVDGKISSIEQIDARTLAVLMQEMEEWGEPYRLLLMPDHGTPLATRAHDGAPIPFALYDSRTQVETGRTYDEACAAATGLMVEEGHSLLFRLLERPQV
nr:cofactor-independent phosphoglycerate mutase [Maliibacterium massiliense]